MISLLIWDPCLHWNSWEACSYPCHTWYYQAEYKETAAAVPQPGTDMPQVTCFTCCPQHCPLDCRSGQIVQVWAFLPHTEFGLIEVRQTENITDNQRLHITSCWAVLCCTSPKIHLCVQLDFDVQHQPFCVKSVNQLTWRAGSHFYILVHLSGAFTQIDLQ